MFLINVLIEYIKTANENTNNIDKNIVLIPSLNPGSVVSCANLIKSKIIVFIISIF